MGESWMDYSECDEVADSLPRQGDFASFEDACAYVDRVMPGETRTVRDNVAERLWRTSKQASFEERGER